MKDQLQSKCQEPEELYIPFYEKNLQKKYRKWTHQENAKYVDFLAQNKDSFLSQHSRRSARIFIKLGQAVQTKNECQCKSHHQKMMRKYSNNIDKLILNLSQCLKLDEPRLELEELGEKKQNVTLGLSSGLEQISFKNFDEEQQQKCLFDVLIMADQEINLLN